MDRQIRLRVARNVMFAYRDSALNWFFEDAGQDDRVLNRTFVGTATFTETIVASVAMVVRSFRAILPESRLQDKLFRRTVCYKRGTRSSARHNPATGYLSGAESRVC